MKRGGLCFVGNNRYVKTNNKYMPGYDQNEETNYIKYEDADHFYECSMSEFLANGKPELVNEFDLEKDIKDI